MFFECLVVRIISNRNPKKEFLLGFDTSYTDFKGSLHLYCLRVNIYIEWIKFFKNYQAM